ncbi:hypothetical protein ACFO4E_14755 [Nocardiopsis mangrovi]|uniref:Uncharacterized protein n=1 Tax=Nocardiopsis mangrovi TaxID=1179818 RepID=A0ABV9DYJ9_9ACTN
MAIDRAHAYGPARFRSEVLGRPPRQEDEPGDPETEVMPPEGPLPHVNRVPEP